MIRKILGLIIILFTINDVMATHLVGGEITYTHISGNTYEVTLTVYRDEFNGSAGAQFDSPALVYVYDVNGNYIAEHSFFLDDPVAAAELIDNPYPNPCLTVPPNIEIQIGVYTKTITLPSGSIPFDLIYARCCRNGALINNLTNPGDQGSTFTVRVPPSITYSNNSPSFNFPPPIFVCLGNSLSFDQSTTDIDGDSLFYKVCAPYQGLDDVIPANTAGNQPPAGFGAPFTPVVWLAPYNVNNQLGGVALTIDPNTGLISGTPNATGSFVVGLCVEEWRNGVLLSEVLRDFQYTVANCNVPDAAIPIVGSVSANDLPNAGNIPATILGIYVKNCDDLTVDFDNSSSMPGGVPATASSASYYWEFGDGDTSTMFEPVHSYADTGTYIVKTVITVGINGQTCSDTGYYVVFVYPIFNPDFSLQDTCVNSSASFIDLSTTAIYDNVVLWEWDFGDGSPAATTQNPSHTYSAPGTYDVVMFAKTNKGCTKLDTNTITINHLPNAIMNVPAQICAGDSFNFLSASNIALGNIDSLYWDLANGVSSSISNPTNSYPNAGVYPIQLNVVSNFGCLDSVQANLTVNALPTIVTSGNDTICPNTSVQVTASGGVNYVWTPAGPLDNANINNPTISPVFPQYYTVEVTDGNNCVNTDSLFVGLKPPPPADAGPDTSVCLNLANMVSFNTTVPLNATGGVTYSWSPATGLSATNISNPDASPSATTEYIVTVSDAQNCIGTDTVKVAVLNPALELIQITTDSLCLGDTVSVEVLDLGDVTAYAWTPPIFISDATINEPNFFPPTNTLYTLTVQNYCYQDNDTVLIEVISLPNLDAGPLDSICFGDPAYQLSATPTDLEIYEWTSTDASISDAGIFNPSIQPTVSSNYYLTATDSVGTLACVNSDSVRILVFSDPTLNITHAADYSGFICQGDSVLLTANSNDAIIYTWDTDPSLSSLNTAATNSFPNDTTPFFVTVENIHGCTNRDSIIVNVQAPINGSMLGDSIMCAGFYVDLEASGGLYYNWYPSEANFSNSSYNITQAFLDSSMQIFVDVSNDCFNDTIYQYITVNQLPAVDAGADFRIIRDDVSGFLDGFGDGKPLWYTSNLDFYGLTDSPAQYGPEVKPEITTHYVLEIENPVTGCKNYDTMTVFVDVLTLLAFPTGFSPNGDGVNDFAKIIKHLNIKTLKELSIYNRFGEKIYTTSDLNAAWDGTYKGTAQEIGVYTFMIKAVSKDDEHIMKKGNLSLIR